MKKALLITFVISSFSFSSGMRFTMEKDRKVQSRQENTTIKDVENKEDSDSSASQRNYEKGDGDVKATKEKINTNFNFRGSRSNKVC